MKKAFFVATLICLFAISNASESKYGKILLNSSKSEAKIESRQNDGVLISLSLSYITTKEVDTEMGTFVSLSSKNLTKTYNTGNPEIPVYSKLLEIPLGAKVTVKVVSYTEEVIDLGERGIQQKISPAQPSISKSDDPASIPFHYNKKVYDSDSFINGKITDFEEIGLLRHIRLGRVIINPIQYNPKTNTLKILNNIKVHIIFENADPVRTKQQKSKYSSPYFGTIRGVINNISSKEFLTNTPVTYVIVSDPMFQETLQPFIEWKRLRGFHVIEAYTNDSEVGTTTTSIKAYLKSLYEHPPEGVNPPSFGLIVGDHEQIPAFSGSATIDDHVSDLYYFEYTNDFLPDVYYGRFSAQSVEQLQPQINKTLEYEKFLIEDPGYLTNQVLVAGVDGNFAPSHGNGHIRYAHQYYSNEDNGINAYTYLYQNAQESTTGISSEQSAASASILEKIGNGVSLANYTAHCSPSGWGDPSFSTYQIESLANDGKFGVWIGNCCQSSSFNEDECFAEAALRAENKGAIGYLGGSNSTYWDEDYYYGVGTGTVVENPVYEDFGPGAYDGFFHTQANETNDVSKWFVTQGQINVAGNLAVEASSSPRKRYYWEIYHLMGDPSLTPYLWVPETMEVSVNPSVIILGISSLSIQAAPYAQAALSFNSKLISVGIADENGNLDLTFNPNEITPGEATLIVTAQNYEPYTTNIPVTPADKPYLIVDAFTTSVSPDYGQNVDLNIVLKNLSNEPYTASDVVATISSTSEYTSITNGSLDAGTIDYNQSSAFENAFSIKIANNVPDQTPLLFTIDITGKYNGRDYNWSQNITIKANAPNFEITTFSIDDNDEGIPSILDPNETANLIVSVKNTGHAAAHNINATLTSSSDYIVINTLEPQIIQSLAVGEESDVLFSVTVSEETPTETEVAFNLNILCGEYVFDNSIETIVGLIPTYIMGESPTIVACVGKFFDTGDEDFNYQDNENITMTFYPSIEGNSLQFIFSSFNCESNYDFLYIYDGENTNAPQFTGSPFSGTNSPGIITATNVSGAITFRFKSDSYLNEPGWSALFTCFDPTAIPNCCSNPSPSPNEFIEVNPILLSWDFISGVTAYDVYIGIDELPNEPTVTTHTNSYYYNVLSNSTYVWKVVPKNSAGYANGCETWQFSTGAVISNLNMTTETIVSCNGFFYDSGGESNTYSNNEDFTLTLFPSTPEGKVSIAFTSFNLESGCDFLSIYDGTMETSNLIGSYSGSQLPPEAIATNDEGMLTVRFTSDGSYVESGWNATINCQGLSSYEVTFKIKDPNNNPIEGVEVSLGTFTNQLTNSYGITTFSNVDAQNQIPYSIEVSSYSSEQGHVDVTNQNVHQIIVLTPVSDEIIEDNPIAIYPNPFNQSIYIKGVESVERIVVSSIIGHEISEYSVLGSEEVTLNLENVPRGLYLVTFHYSSGETLTRKILKQ